MNQLFAIALGGALGAVLRYLASSHIHRLVGNDFPYGTLSVNVLGSLMMGFIYIILLERIMLAEQWRAILVIGFLGAFTTFSTFSIESFNLVQSGQLLKASLNIFSNVFLCICATWIGVLAGRQL